MHIRKTIPALLTALVMLLCLPGCSSVGADRLYALPRMAEEYVQLEEMIARRISAGGEYASPLGGSHRQSVQFQDLDGDGREEAIAFLADSTHTPSVCIYRQDGEGEFYLFVTIEGVGDAIGSVDYADLSGSGTLDIVLTWQLSADIRLLSVYAVSASAQTQLLSENCSEYFVCDLDGDGVEELLSLNIDYAGGCSLVRYVFDEEGQATSSSALLSDGITQVLRAKTGNLSDGAAALFIESRWDDRRLVTDVFTAPGGELENITLGAGGHSDTLRTGDTYAADINADRVMEVPEPDGELLDWYSFDSGGKRTQGLTTYHDPSGNWYLEIAGDMLRGELTVRTGTNLPGEAAATFSLDGEPALVIYTLTGENRLERAKEAGRFLLAEDGTTVYAAEIMADGAGSEDDVARRFHLIYTEWQTGELQ